MPVKKSKKRWEEYPFPKYLPFETCIRTIIKCKKKDPKKESTNEQKIMKNAEGTKKSEFIRPDGKIRSDIEITCMEVVESVNNSIGNIKNYKEITMVMTENVKDVKDFTEDATGNVKCATINGTEKVEGDVKNVTEEGKHAEDLIHDFLIDFKESDIFRCLTSTSNSKGSKNSSESNNGKGIGITKVGNRIDVKVKKEVKIKKKVKRKTDKRPWSSCDEKCGGKGKKESKDTDKKKRPKPESKQCSESCSASCSRQSKSDNKLLKNVKCKTKKNPSMKDVIQSVETNGRRCCDLIELYLRETCRFYNGYYFDEGAEQSHFQETFRELGRSLACLCKNCFQYIGNVCKQIFL